MEKTTISFLAQPIESTPLSSQVKSVCNRQKIGNLQALTALKVDELLDLPGFNVHCLLEVFKYLKENGCAHLMEKK